MQQGGETAAQTATYSTESGTPRLYDEGEEDWPIKLHLGCGGVYLEGYVNCDIDGVLAAEFPAMRDYNTTTVSNYYARLDGDMNHLPQRRPTVADWKLDVSYLPYQNETVDKILAVQVFEHFTPSIANKALKNWRNVLKVGRPLVMSVPDMSSTLAMLSTDFDFAARHLRGSGNGYNQHRAWYTRSGLCGLLMDAGFAVVMLDNFHFYPALCVRGVKL